MSSPYIGEIRLFGGNFAPAGWAFCDGQLMPISENETLFVLIGTTYGGDGQSTFALPDLRGRLPLHQGSNVGVTYQLGEQGGVESVTLSVNQMPAHSHALSMSATIPDQLVPTNNVTAEATKRFYTANATNLQPMAANAIAPVGGSQPHDNLQPYLCVSFIISLFGVFPSPT